MNPETPSIESRAGASQGSLATYTAGFVLSLALTLTPYLLVHQHLVKHALLVAAIVGFAVVQLLIQLIFFLHLDKGSQRRWNILVLLFALMVVTIIVFGSLWIMNNLNYRMNPAQMVQYMSNQSGF